MSSEKFCLKWNDFESNITSAFRDLKDEKDFFDVTIACGDDQVQAHKVILSACSPFFKNLLRRNQHPHPLLYLKGITFSGIQSVLNFMYYGEANVAQEDLNTFLSVAEELKVKGLTQSQSQNQQGSSSSKPSQTAAKIKPTTTFKAAQEEEEDEIQEVESHSQIIKMEQGEASKPGGLQVAQYDEQEQYFEDYDESYTEDFMTVNTDSNTIVEKGRIYFSSCPELLILLVF